MRLSAPLALIAVAVLVAGCIGPEADSSSTGPALGYCPQWQQGPGQFTGTVLVDASNPESTAQVVPDSLSLGRRPLDLYRMRLDRLEVSGGQLEVRAATAGNESVGRNWFDYRSAGQPFQSVPFLVFRGQGNDTGHEFDVLLSPIQQSDASAATPIQLAWRFVADGSEGHASVDYTVTYHYRVCGAAA